MHVVLIYTLNAQYTRIWGAINIKIIFVNELECASNKFIYDGIIHENNHLDIRTHVHVHLYVYAWPNVF